MSDWPYDEEYSHFVYGGFGPSEEDIEKDFLCSRGSNSKDKKEAFKASMRSFNEKQGFMRCVRKDGTIAGVGFHKNGKLVGPFEGYDKSGKLLYTIDYTPEGIIKEFAIYYPNGKKRLKATDCCETLGFAEKVRYVSRKGENLPLFLTDHENDLDAVVDSLYRGLYAQSDNWRNYEFKGACSLYDESGKMISQFYKSEENEKLAEKRKSSKRTKILKVLESLSEMPANRTRKDLKQAIVQALRKKSR